MSNIPLYITCACGLARLLEDAVKGEDGEKVTLPPCPRCGMPVNGFCSGGRIILTYEVEE